MMIEISRNMDKYIYERSATGEIIRVGEYRNGIDGYYIIWYK